MYCDFKRDLLPQSLTNKRRVFTLCIRLLTLETSATRLVSDYT